MLRKLLLTVVLSLALVGLTGQAAQANTISSNYYQAKRAVCYYFGSYCSQAMSVVKCETGGTYSIWAGYGKHQYWGLFQMGAKERATYGHAWNPWGQAKAAHAYFMATNRTWGPWSCKPW